MKRDKPKKICVITDNVFLYNSFLKIIKDEKYEKVLFDFFCSKIKSFSPLGNTINAICLKEMDESFFCQYDLFLSLHCKQIFPPHLVNHHRCVNIHPGYNPFNRGWCPQVFSILNGQPTGVTIHEMDEEIDHGHIIKQSTVPIYSWSTSYSVYKDIQNEEVELLEQYLPLIIEGDYNVIQPSNEGTINSISDFNKLCKINLDEKISWKEAIDRLRALSFRGYQNAFFIDSNGCKVYLELHLNCG